MRRLAALVAAAACAGCGADERAAEVPATLPPEALPELASRERPLDAAALADDALERVALERLLAEAGFVVGFEREFSGKSRSFDRVVARTLVFADDEGAEAYLGWLRGHPEDILGQARRERPLPLGQSGLLFALVPCSTCKKELPTFLAGWRRGETVYSLLAAGPGADRAALASLARPLDQAVG